MRSTIIAFFTIVFLFSCDPGWHYKSLDNEGIEKAHKQSTISDTDGVRAFANCSLFGMGLMVEVEIVNHGLTSLSVDTGSLMVLDAKNVELIKEWSKCAGSKKGEAVFLEAGNKCELVGMFEVNPTSGPFGIFPNHDLRQLTILMDGLTREGNHIPLKLILKWDL
jgi:hypothetical protein